MRRRDFLRFAVSSLAMGVVPVRLFGKDPSTVAVSEGTDYGAVTRNAIAALGGMGRFVRKGDVVVVKPNIGWDRKPEFGACTHPAVVRAVCEECVRAGAKKVKVFDNTCNDPRRCYENSGIQGALKGLKNVEMKQMENERYKKTRIRGVFLKEWELYDEALLADVFINVPVAKHHSLTKLSLGLKNMMGIMGGNRGYLHRSMDDALADVNGAVRSHLVVTDATRILLRHGPQGGNLSDVKVLNRVVASADVVAADAYATTFFGFSPTDVSATTTAYRRGLGEINLSKIKIIKA